MSYINCCKGCTPETGRSAEPNCHMTCERYLAQAERHTAIHAKAKEDGKQIKEYKATQSAKMAHARRWSKR